MKDLYFTHISECARKKMRLSRDEYALCNYISTWSSFPGSARPGWCNRTLAQKAEFIGVTSRGLTKMQNRMIELGLVEKDTMTAHVRASMVWWEITTAAKEQEEKSQSDGEQSRLFRGELSSHPENNTGNKVPTTQGTKFPQHREQSSHNTGNKVPTHNKVIVLSKSNNQNTNVVETDDAVLVGKSNVETVVDFLNECAKPARGFSPKTRRTVEAVNARLKEKYTTADICLVIEHKVDQWRGDTRMEQYLRPETLFGTGKFESYLVAATSWAAQGKPSQQSQQHSKNGQFNGNNHRTPIASSKSFAGAFSDYTEKRSDDID